jgi:ribonuclease VapC
MFVGACAIVAILTREPEADALADVLEGAHSTITSPITIFEAALGICRKRHASVEEAHEDVREFLGVAGVRTVSIIEREAESGARRFLALRQGAGASGAAQPRRLLCLRCREEPPDVITVQGRGL